MKKPYEVRVIYKPDEEGFCEEITFPFSTISSALAFVKRQKNIFNVKSAVIFEDKNE